jgi:hypothetical protein
MSGEFKGFVDRWEKAADDTRQIVASMSDAFLLVDVTASNIVPRRWAHMAGRTIYRVDTRKQHVEVRAWGIGESTHIVAREIMRYDNVQVLPEWMQRKIAVLMTLDPAKVTDEIPDLGAHVAHNVFWVFAIDGETLGCDPRSEGQSSGT